MKLSFTYMIVSLLGSTMEVQGFTHTMYKQQTLATTSNLRMSSNDSDDQAKRMQEIMAEEANNPVNMKAAAQAMKNIKPEDMNRMLQEMDSMNPIQKGALKAMGMDPEMMKKTMEMMRDNPKMVESAQKLMENMSPAELLEQSRLAQQRMKNMSAEDLEQTSKVMGEIPQEQIDQAVEILKDQQQQQQEEQTKEPATVSVGPKSDDPEVIDTMFKIAELMSEPATGGCTFAGFASIPVIQLLSGDREFDLSPKELRECWEEGSLAATRVDREGFVRVWNEVQDYFEDDIMGEARKEAKKRVQKKVRPGGSSSSAPSATTTIGDDMSADQVEAMTERVKNISENEVDTVLEQMQKMGPTEEARMRAMGVDPDMMRRSAEMMKNNPAMRQAAQAAMKNMTPEQMLQASKQAQQQLQNMSKEDIEKVMDQNKNN